MTQQNPSYTNKTLSN